MQYNNINKLLKLKDVNVKKVIEKNDSTEIHITTKPKTHICPCCGNETTKIHDYRLQKIKDIPFMYRTTYLILNKRRYQCKCGKRFYESYDFLPRYHRMTRRTIQSIATELRKVSSLKSVAEQFNVSTPTVTRILNTIRHPKPKLPKVLCIDEFKGNAETGKFQAILVDGKRHQVIDILPTRSTDYLIDYFMECPRSERLRVEFFVCDMWQPYRDIAASLFPNAKIIVDKYHFVRQVNWAIENVRKQAQKTMPTSLRKYYKRSRKLLLASYNDLSQENQCAVDIMLLYHDDLRQAHYLKELFYKIRNEVKYSKQRELMDQWIKYAEKSNIKVFERLAKTYGNWRSYILNGYKYGYTNGPTEGFNNKIKVLKRVSYGLKNFNRYRNRILLTCN